MTQIKKILILLTLSQYSFGENKVTLKEKAPQKAKEISTKKTPSPVKKQKQLSADELKKYQTMMLNSKAMTILFDEEIYRKARNKTIKKKGKAYLLEKKFWWQVGEEAWIYDGINLYQYDENKKYAIRYTKMDKKQELEDLVEMITDLKSLLKKYSLVSAKKESQTVFIDLKNKKKSEILSLNIELAIGSRTEKQVKKTKKGTQTILVQVPEVKMKKLALNLKGGNKTTFLFKTFEKAEIKPERLKIPAKTMIKVF